MSPQQSIFKCKHCGATLGITCARVLVVGAVKYTRSTRLPCAKCSRVTLWSANRTNNLHTSSESVL